jgi:hypothetical protein
MFKTKRLHFMNMPILPSEKSLVLVVGAGASNEANLPIGSELKRDIARLLDFRYKDGFKRISGDGAIEEAFGLQARKNAPTSGDINPYLRSSRHISDAMPQAISIDNFIDSRRDDQMIAFCGKLAIARRILQAESTSSMYVDPANYDNKLNFSALESTWFSALFQLLTENCQATEVAQRFSKIAIISFNYDRCIEHYLHSSLQNYFAMSPQNAATALSKLEIHHPYGTVGELTWQKQLDGIPFGASPHPQQLLSSALRLRTFTEGTDAITSDISVIRRTLSAARRIAFLGFAFHPLNMQLLFSEAPSNAASRECSIYATALGMSAADLFEVTNEICQMTRILPTMIRLRSDLKCAGLFQEFRRSLSLH